MWSLVVVKSGNKWLILAAAVLLSLVLSPCASAWTWPVDGTVLRPFVAEGDPYAGGQHRGIDIAARAGADVRSAATGVVAFVGQLPHEGLCLTIRTADGYSVTLVHLGSIGVRMGTAIEEGEVVGTIGPSGDAEWGEPYVHLGIRLTADPHGYLDPLSLLPAREASSASPVQSAPGAQPAPPLSVTPERVAPATRRATPRARNVAQPRARVNTRRTRLPAQATLAGSAPAHTPPAARPATAVARRRSLASHLRPRRPAPSRSSRA